MVRNRARSAVPFTIDQLETRTLLSAVIAGRHGVYSVLGDGGTANTISVGLNVDPTKIDITLNGSTQSVDTNLMKALVILGGSQADVLTIDQTNGIFTVPTLIAGYGGDDTITGGDENDLIFGGHGNDLIHSGEGKNIVFGGADNDTIITGNGRNFVFGGKGDDNVTCGSGNDVVFGLAGNDTINLGDGNNSAYGGGHDSITGGIGNDTLWGTLSGADTLVGGGGTDVTRHGRGRSLDGIRLNDIAGLRISRRLGGEI